MADLADEADERTLVSTLVAALRAGERGHRQETTPQLLAFGAKIGEINASGLTVVDFYSNSAAFAKPVLGHLCAGAEGCPGWHEAAAAGKRLGYDPLSLNSRVAGKALESACVLAGIAEDVAAFGRPSARVSAD
jgi:hypothetical protein